MRNWCGFFQLLHNALLSFWISRVPIHLVHLTRSPALLPAGKFAAQDGYDSTEDRDRRDVSSAGSDDEDGDKAQEGAKPAAKERKIQWKEQCDFPRLMWIIHQNKDAFVLRFNSLNRREKDNKEFWSFYDMCAVLFNDPECVFTLKTRNPNRFQSFAVLLITTALSSSQVLV